MVNFDIGQTETEVEGCIIAIRVVVNKEGELTHEELEAIDEVMGGIGRGETGQRIEVSTKPDSNKASVEYVYQKGFNIYTENQVGHWFKRMRAKTPFDDPYFKLGTRVVEFK